MSLAIMCKRQVSMLLLCIKVISIVQVLGYIGLHIAIIGKNCNYVIINEFFYYVIYIEKKSNTMSQKKHESK